MIRHAPEAALFPVDPLPVPVIEPALRAFLVFFGSHDAVVAAASHPASAALAAIPVAPVTMAADPERRPAANTPANPLTQ